MLYRNIEFHNVAELVPRDGGLAMPRLPADVRAELDEPRSAETLFHSSGVELRFRMVSEEVRLTLHMEDVTEGLPASLYFGCFQGPWETSVKMIGREPTTLTIRMPRSLPSLRRLAEEHRHPFRPEVVRVILPYDKCVFDDVEGELLPPQPGDTPEKTLLCYGSSITHGSLALGTPHTYVYRMAGQLGCDVRDLGMAGCCHLEESVLRAIRRDPTWDIATVEMGINMLSCFTEEAFRARVRRAVEVLSEDGRPVFVTSIFRAIDEDEKYGRFRQIVREEAEGRLPFISGDELLYEEDLVAADLVHPGWLGHERIADRWVAHIRGALGQG